MRMPGFSAEKSLYNRGGQYEHLDKQIDRIDKLAVVPAWERFCCMIYPTSCAERNLWTGKCIKWNFKEKCWC